MKLKMVYRYYLQFADVLSKKISVYLAEVNQKKHLQNTRSWHTLFNVRKGFFSQLAEVCRILSGKHQLFGAFSTPQIEVSLPFLFGKVGSFSCLVGFYMAASPGLGGRSDLLKVLGKQMKITMTHPDRMIEFNFFCCRIGLK